MKKAIFILIILDVFITSAAIFVEKQTKNNFFNTNEVFTSIENDTTEFKINSSINNNDPLVYIHNYFLKTEYKNVALEITAMSWLETGVWKSDFHMKRNNYWSTKIKPNGITCKNGEKECLATYNNIEHACEKMLSLLRRKKYATMKEEFLLDLKRKKFATDPNYITKVKKCSMHVAKKLKEKKIQ